MSAGVTVFPVLQTVNAADGRQLGTAEILRHHALHPGHIPLS